MDDGGDEIKWTQEIIGAALPDAEKMMKGINKANQNLIDHGIKEVEKISFKLKPKDFLGGVGYFKEVGIGKFLENSFHTCNHEFKFRGVSTGFSVWDAASLTSNLIDIWKSSDESFNEKMDATGRELSSQTGSMLGAKIGNIAGQAIGGFLGSFIPIPGLGTLAGRTIGGILGTIGGSIIGGFIGGLAYDVTKNVINKGAEYLAGIKGQFQSGGVEFIYPKEIDKFKKKICF